jgi:hypothetical protein
VQAGRGRNPDIAVGSQIVSFLFGSEVSLDFIVAGVSGG